MLNLEPIKKDLAAFGAFTNTGETWEGDGAGGIGIDLGGKGFAFVTQWTDRGEPRHATPQDVANANHLVALHNEHVPALIAEVERYRQVLLDIALKLSPSFFVPADNSERCIQSIETIAIALGMTAAELDEKLKPLRN